MIVKIEKKITNKKVGEQIQIDCLLCGSEVDLGRKETIKNTVDRMFQPTCVP